MRQDLLIGLTRQRFDPRKISIDDIKPAAYLPFKLMGPVGGLRFCGTVGRCHRRRGSGWLRRVRSSLLSVLDRLR
jgi:hypothetical protein